jgi:hypothetical protein
MGAFKEESGGGVPCRSREDAYFLVYNPVEYVETKIRKKGSHVPKKLRNMSKLFSIKRATTKISIRMTKETKMTAVWRGAV